MANMARKLAPGEYQIGIYTVTRKGKYWNARARDGFSKWFHTLEKAHVALTGETMHGK